MIQTKKNTFAAAVEFLLDQERCYQHCVIDKQTPSHGRDRAFDKSTSEN